MDLSNHVILPREDYIDLQTAAWEQIPMTTKDRIGNTLQTTIMLAGVAVAFVGASWGWAKVMDWREERIFQRQMRQENKLKSVS